MAAESTPDLQLEIANVLLIDVVGYSKLLVNEQAEALRQLNAIVRASECFRAAEAKDKLIRLPTGDGMALLFFENLEQPARCALEIGQALKDIPQVQVRMGIHSGPVNQIPDVNDRINIVGSGINVAQRVLDCGDAGHILVSKHVADDLGEYQHWQPYLRDLGECEVKHGLRLHLFNLCKDGVGNPAPPAKLKRGKRWKPDGTVRPVAAPRLSRWALLLAFILASFALILSFAIWLRRPSVPTAGQILETAPIPEKSIAVLPFENLTQNQNFPLPDGVQDEILTDLAKVADLKVISRTSVKQYKGSLQRNIREIAKQLGVAHILEGTVQATSNRVRVTVQLIDARNDNHLWAERYDRDLADVFGVESEVAEKIVSQLKTKLSPREKAAIEERPTANLEAYDLYLRGRELIDGAVFSSGNELFEAVRLLEQATQRDPSFALAYYQLAHAHDQLYVRAIDHSARRLNMAESAIQSLRRLKPDSGETHLAAAKDLYWGHLDYDNARKELDAARQSLPNEPLIFLLAGYIDRRQSRWDESLAQMQQALKLDPQSPQTVFILQQIARTYELLHRYPEMIATLDRALTRAPDNATIQVSRAQAAWQSRADPVPLQTTLQTLLGQKSETVGGFASQWLQLARSERDWNMAAEALKMMPEDGCHEEALPFPRSWCEGLIARIQNDSTAARTEFNSARAETEQLVRDQPDNGPALCVLGVIDSALGNKKAAIREGRRALELLPISKDSINGNAIKTYLALIYAWSGKKDDALTELADSAKLPASVHYGDLKLDPIWDPIRDDPRFQKIVGELAPK